MALVLVETYTHAFNGSLPGGPIVNVNDRYIARPIVGNQNPRRIGTYTPAWSTIAAELFWEELTDDEKATWEARALVTELFDTFGSPRYVNGFIFQSHFNTNRTMYDPSVDFQRTAPDAPTWGAVPRFWEFGIINDEDDIVLEATTNFDTGTVIAAYLNKPNQRPWRYRKAGRRYMGRVVFAGGLLVGDQTSDFNELFQTLNNDVNATIESGWWITLYQVQNGYVRPLPDPCYPPNPSYPPVDPSPPPNPYPPQPPAPPSGNIFVTIQNSTTDQTMMDNGGEQFLFFTDEGPLFLAPLEDWGPIGPGGSQIVLVPYDGEFGSPDSLILFFHSDPGDIERSWDGIGDDISWLVDWPGGG